MYIKSATDKTDDSALNLREDTEREREAQDAFDNLVNDNGQGWWNDLNFAAEHGREWPEPRSSREDVPRCEVLFSDAEMNYCFLEYA